MCEFCVLTWSCVLNVDRSFSADNQRINWEWCLSHVRQVWEKDKKVKWFIIWNLMLCCVMTSVVSQQQLEFEYFVVVTWRRIRWAGQLAHTEKREMPTGFWWADLKKRNCLEELGVDGGVALNYILKKWDGKAWNGFIWIRVGTGGRLLQAQ